MSVDCRAISPFPNHCDGYGMPGATGLGYVSVFNVSCGVCNKTDDSLIDSIVSYDRAECDGAYIGQINMLTASSFCGPMGRIWGHDLAVHDDIAEHHIEPLFTVKQFDGSELPVYDAAPLQEAAIALFGTDADRHFPPMPGAHVICANKGRTAYRPRTGEPNGENQGYGVWALLSLTVARDRDQCACLFIEDAGVWTKNDNEQDLLAFLDQHRRNVAASITACGQDSGILFDRSYVAGAHAMLKPGQVGEALCAAPYVTLAQNAVPADGFDALESMTLSQWKTEKGLD